MSLWKVDKCEGSDSDANSLDELKPESNDQTNLIMELTARLGQLEAKWKRAEASRKVSDAKVKVFESKLKSSEAMIEELNAKLKESDAQLEEFEIYINESDEKIKQLELNLNLLQLKVCQHKQDTTDLAMENEETIEDVQKELVNFNQKLTKVDSQMNKKVKELNGDVNRLRKQILLSCSEMEEVRKKNISLNFSQPMTSELQKKVNDELYEAAKERDVKEIRSALDRGADISCRFNGFIKGSLGPFLYDDYSPIMVASSRGHTSAVEYLLLRGSLVEETDDRDNNALHCASINDCASVISVLLDYGADINHVNRRNWTPLHCASSQGNPSSVRLLLERGADATLTNCNSLTALKEAGCYNRSQTDAVKDVFQEFMDD